MRSFPFLDYVIFYRLIDGGVEIVRVLHGSFYIPSRGPNARPAGAPLEHYGPLQSQEAVKYTSAIFEFVCLQMARWEGSG